MEKLTSLTEEQIAKFPEYVEKFSKNFFTHKNIDLPRATKFVHWLYEISGLTQVPEVKIARSPMEAQKMANEMNGNKEYVYYNFSTYLSSFDNVWLSFFEYFRLETSVKIDNELYLKYIEVLELSIYDSLQFENVCILVELPLYVKTNPQHQMHNPEGPAIEFADGFKLYSWNGVIVPEKLIMTPDEITQEDIVKESNAEIRRAYREKLGAKVYYDRISNGKGLTLLDEDVDGEGNPMRLYETTIEDEIINKKVQFVEVMCPSTKRIYNIYPPRQNSKNVWEAKADTFSGEKIQVRHGDVGLLNLNQAFESPQLES